MSEPATLTVGAIAALAFTKFLESSAGEAAKKLTPLALEKMDTLGKKIQAKLRGIPEIDALKVTELEERLAALEAAIRCN